MARQNLQEQINAAVRDALAGFGITLPGPRGAAEQTDRIEFGSDKHRQFLGLVIVDGEDDPTGFTIFKSRASGETYRLQDEISVVSLYPGVDPDKAALLTLRQKVNELEGGKPPIPDRSPGLWTPVDQFTVPVVGR